MSKKESRPQKRHRRSIIAFEMVRLDRTATEPLHDQLYRQIRDELISGKFGDGTSRLPSSRALANDLGISRSTVTLAFSKLHAEGYLRSKPASGTFVSNLLPETYLSAGHAKTDLPIRGPVRTSERRFSRKKGPTCCAMRRIAATPICARQSRLICAISERCAVIRTRS